MSATTQKRETAADISKRYGLADLVRARMMTRRLYVNALARKANVSYQDSLDVLDPMFSPLDVSLLHPRDLYYMYDPVTSRRSLPAVENRYLYNRRLAELEAERLDAEDRAERLVNRYLTRSKSKKALANDKDTPDNENAEEGNDTEQTDKEDEDVEILEDELYGDPLEAASYLDLAPPYDIPTWRHARRLLRRRLYPYRFRPLGVTTRLMEKRLKDLYGSV